LPKDDDIISVKVLSRGGSKHEREILADRSGELTMKSETGTGMTLISGPRSLVTSYFPQEDFFLPEEKGSADSAK